jgi:hypothetical protein
MAEMAYMLSGRLLVAANTKKPVPSEEWARCVRDIEVHANTHWVDVAPRIVVFTEGGGPDAVQRKALFEAVPQIREASGAVLSSNPIVRGVATAFSWFTKGFRAFPPSALGEALKSLGLDEKEKAVVSSALMQARRELGDARVQSISRAT